MPTLRRASRIGVANPTSSPWRPGGRRPGHPRPALYVTTDDLLQAAPQLAPWRPAIGITPKLSDAELVTLAVLQALLGFCSEARWLGYARAHLGGPFPYPPKQPGYNKRLRAAADLIRQVIRALASETTFRTDDVGVADSTQWNAGVPGRPPRGRRWLAGPLRLLRQPLALVRGLRLHLVCTLQGLPVGFAVAGAKADQRQVLLGILAADPALVAARPGQTLIADKHYYGRGFQAELVAQGVRLLRPAARASRNRPLRTCSGRCGRSSSRST
jgi:hypothetical protein